MNDRALLAVAVVGIVLNFGLWMPSGLAVMASSIGVVVFVVAAMVLALLCFWLVLGLARLACWLNGPFAEKKAS